MEQEEITEEIIEVVEGEEVEVPEWMTETQDDDESGVSDQVPLAKFLDVKDKLRGQIGKRDTELDQLKQEIEQLKSTAKPPAKPEVLKRPRLNDFGSDEEYESAMDAWEDQRAETQLSTVEQRRAQETQSALLQTQRKQSMDEHYDRAGELVKKYSMKPEVYKKADTTVRQSLAAVLPKNANADLVFDTIVDSIGEGSEKTILHLGIKKESLDRFRALLTDDPSGLKAAVYLGRLTKEIEGTTKRKSQATAPAAQVNGDAPLTGNAAKLKKDYDKQHKANQTGKAFTTKRAAKKAGIDTSKW